MSSQGFVTKAMKMLFKNALGDESADQVPFNIDGRAYGIERSLDNQQQPYGFKRNTGCKQDHLHTGH